MFHLSLPVNKLSVLSLSLSLSLSVGLNQSSIFSAYAVKSKDTNMHKTSIVVMLLLNHISVAFRSIWANLVHFGLFDSFGLPRSVVVHFSLIDSLRSIWSILNWL